MFRSVCSRRITSTSRSLQLNLEWVETEQEQAHLQNIPPPTAAVPRPIKPATANICQHGVCCILKVKERILSTLSTSFTFTLHSTMTFFKTQKPLNSSNAFGVLKWSQWSEHWLAEFSHSQRVKGRPGGGQTAASPHCDEDFLLRGPFFMCDQHFAVCERNTVLRLFLITK